LEKNTKQQTQIIEYLNELKLLIGKLYNKREPSLVLLATSLNLIITSIDHAHHQLKIIIEYRSKMRELHSLVSLNDKLKI